MNRVTSIMLGLGISVQSYAFPCFFTIMKDSCWTSYNVTVTAYDAMTNKEIVNVVIPTGTSWEREQFACDPKQKLRFQAQFTPVFWESDTGKIYNGQNFWTLPDQVAAGDTAWNIRLCYPKDFAEVPFPPEGTSNCKCDDSAIPAIKPQ